MEEQKIEFNQKIVNNKDEFTERGLLRKNTIYQDRLVHTEYSLKKILSGKNYYRKRKTKIIASIGPASNTIEKLKEMIDAGMDIARVSSSQGSQEYLNKVIDNIRQAFEEKNKVCSILLDIHGPCIRTGKLQNGGPIELIKGDILEIVTDQDLIGDDKRISCNFEDLPKCVNVGEILDLQEGLIIVKVVEILLKSIKVEVITSGKLNQNKRLYFPDFKIQTEKEILQGPKQDYYNLPTITNKDEQDILEVGLKKNVDFVTISRCVSSKDIEQVRNLLGPKGANINIIAKIGSKSGLANFEQILEAADGIMVVRGMLAGEISSQKVFTVQKYMIAKANKAGKPVIITSQMFESMINNPRPTRAEASDATNAVLDGTDCICLRAETSVGKYPVEAIKILSDICNESELCINYKQNFQYIMKSLSHQLKGRTATSAMAVSLSFDLNVNLIISLSSAGSTPRALQKFKPSATIMAISPDDKVIGQLKLVRNVVTIKVQSYSSKEQIVKYALKAAKDKKFASQGDLDSLEHFHPDSSVILHLETIN